MSAPESSLTLVVPCHNEAARLDTTAFLDWVRGSASRRVCFVNDASTDETADVLNQLSEGHPQIAVLHLPRNHGKAGAVRAGMLQHTASEFVGFWDADLAAPLAEVEPLAQVFARHPTLQVVAGIRVLRFGATVQRSFVRHVLSRLFVTAAGFLLSLPAYDTQCGAKLFRCGVVQLLFAEPFVSPWLFDIELYLRLRRLYSDTGLGACVHEHPLTEWKAVGRSSLGFGDFVSAPFQLWRISRHYR
ncbi:MAG: glycosyltransferase [SAR202 cluster bacterium]|jgi:glycosyltransferase involved in cell wall biosynthesis|nr:glycosyltransferase [SAR202 cluster bacterium]MQG56651.1 glycosyltransferase [SAR202 cluster bacterium]MQG70409.1 glycosyltransferase [SAR202 cluster bacterium]HAL46696.1 glycosyl transferase family 2 [Dehalococcoidia bacterium]|tara:strand:- start:4328 stop:5062 length:735 start_codon:yes stop_codon:yes gene_type:complete